MKLEITQTIEIEVPPVPMHLKVQGAKKASMPISEMPIEALREIGVAWTEALIEAAYPYTEEETS
jgi:hypothetical protein